VNCKFYKRNAYLAGLTPTLALTEEVKEDDPTTAADWVVEKNPGPLIGSEEEDEPPL